MSDKAATDDRYGGLGIVTLPLSAFAAATFVAWAYWPGLMTWDSVSQYGEAISGEIYDWHPPVMQWIWRQAIALYPGPPPILILQLALYWGGLSLLASAFWLRQRRGLAWAVLACGLWPLGLALSGMILKDCLMAGSLLMASGAIALRRDRASVTMGVVAAVMIVFAATLRFNAFAACLPLLVALLPRSWRSNWLRLLLASTVAALVLVTIMPTANRVIGARPSGVELSLVIFDLGGITEHSGVDAFPAELEVSDPVRVNHGCYQSSKWDSYSDWVDPECPLGITAWNDNVDPTEIQPYSFWLRAVLTHPVAYAEHRLTHFATNTRIFSVADSVERPVPERSAPNLWDFHVTPNIAMSAIDGLAIAIAHTPLGWPVIWISLALGAIIASWGLPNARLVAPIGLSSLLYGCGYLTFSVASELRYHLWTELAALIAIVLALSDTETRARKRFWWAWAPVGIALFAGTAGRLMA